MADEAVVQPTITTGTSAQTEAPAAESTVQETTTNFYDGALPDLGDVDISEEALRGEAPKQTETPVESQQPTEEKPAEEPTTTEVDSASSEPSGKEGETATVETTEAPAEVDPQAQKPPKGFVPLAAVKEARGEIAALKAQIAALMQAQTTSTASAGEANQWADFKELTPQELADLTVNDPAEAVQYTAKLIGFKEYQRVEASRAAQVTAVKAMEDSIVNMAYNRMEASLPGLFQEGSTVGQELAQFASEVGFGSDLFHLTNPNVRIILPGQDTPVLLGEGAAAIVEMLANMRGKMQSRSTEESAMREQLTKEITEKVQAELLEKFKTQAPGFKTLASVPGTTPDSGADALAGRVLTADDLAKMSDAEIERYLSGA